MKEIKINWRKNYGVAQAYPDCELSTLFTLVAGRKTLTCGAIALIKKAGYEVIARESSLADGK